MIEALRLTLVIATLGLLFTCTLLVVVRTLDDLDEEVDE